MDSYEQVGILQHQHVLRGVCRWLLLHPAIFPSHTLPVQHLEPSVSNPDISLERSHFSPVEGFPLWQMFANSEIARILKPAQLQRRGQNQSTATQVGRRTRSEQLNRGVSERGSGS